MAFWDSTQNRIIRIPPKPAKAHPGWEERDCGCCDGLRWGGDIPTECGDCAGNGIIFVHLKSGVIAQWPGGPFLGRETRNEHRR